MTSIKQSFFQQKAPVKQIFSRYTTWVNVVRCFFLMILVSCAAGTGVNKQTDEATLYIIGDSTVKNGSGKGGGGLWGWGDFIAPYFDSDKLEVKNRARGGRSSRTYISEGLWQNVLDSLQQGDFVLMQFGHNDGGAINDTLRARGTIKGNNEESVEIDNLITKKHEVVHSYGWYIRKYIQDAKAKGAIPIVLSPVPRNIWEDGKVARASDDYGKWAAEAAQQAGAYFIDLNEIVAKHYETAGQEQVDSGYFLEDHTHTNEAGARINAASVVEGLLQNKAIPLNNYLTANAKKKAKEVVSF